MKPRRFTMPTITTKDGTESIVLVHGGFVERFWLIVTPNEATMRARALRPESMLAKLLAKSVAASDAAGLLPACPNSPLKSLR
jgi:hypothetical protein